MSNTAGPVLSPGLCLQARTLLDMDEGELAFAALLPPGSLHDYERGTGPLPSGKQAALRRVLERAGAEFVPDIGGRGVRLRGCR